MGNKRGLGHVEFIISFVLFVGFLMFALYFFNPLRGDRIVDSTLYYTLDEISNNVSVDLELLSATIDNGILDGKVRIRFEDRGGENVYVEDSNGEKLDSYFDDLTEIVYVERGNERFLVFKFSEDFPEGNVNLKDGMEILSSENYSISSSDMRAVLSENRIIELVSEYREDEGYEKLKEEFNLPSRANFAFSIVFENETISASRNIPEGLEVFSDRERYEIIRTSGEIAFADLEVRIW